MRLIASHLLVALVAVGMGYVAAPELAGWLATERPAIVEASPDPLAGLVAEDSCPSCRAELLRLRVEIAELERLVSAGDAATVPDEAGPIEAPEGLADRFKEGVLLEAFRRAAGDDAFDVEIASVDCTEYPCIIYGHIEDDEVALDTFLAAPAFDAYGEGSAQLTFSWGDARLPEIEEPRRYFGAVFYPESDAVQRGVQIRRRLRFRSQQMWEAVRGESR